MEGIAATFQNMTANKEAAKVLSSKVEGCLYSPNCREGIFSETVLLVHPPIDASISLRLRFCKGFVIKGMFLFSRSTRGESICSPWGARQRGASNGSTKRGQEGTDANQEE